MQIAGETLCSNSSTLLLSWAGMVRLPGSHEEGKLVVTQFRGYGRCWLEPLAVGRWARFKQKLREPATLTDYAAAYAIIVLGTIAGSIWVLS